MLYLLPPCAGKLRTPFSLERFDALLKIPGQVTIWTNSAKLKLFAKGHRKRPICLHCKERLQPQLQLLAAGGGKKGSGGGRVDCAAGLYNSCLLANDQDGFHLCSLHSSPKQQVPYAGDGELFYIKNSLSSIYQILD